MSFTGWIELTSSCSFGVSVNTYEIFRVRWSMCILGFSGQNYGEGFREKEAGKGLWIWLVVHTWGRNYPFQLMHFTLTFRHSPSPWTSKHRSDQILMTDALRRVFYTKVNRFMVHLCLRSCVIIAWKIKKKIAIPFPWLAGRGSWIQRSNSHVTICTVVFIAPVFSGLVYSIVSLGLSTRWLIKDIFKKSPMLKAWHRLTLLIFSQLLHHSITSQETIIFLFLFPWHLFS